MHRLLDLAFDVRKQVWQLASWMCVTDMLHAFPFPTGTILQTNVCSLHLHTTEMIVEERQVGNLRPPCATISSSWGLAYLCGLLG